MKRTTVNILKVVCLALILLALMAPVGVSAAITPRSIHVAYQGGPILSHPEVSAVYLGSYGDRYSGLARYFSAFFDAVVDSDHVIALGEYGVGTGRFLGSITDGRPVPSRITDTQIRAYLRRLVAAGSLPSVSRNTLFFLFSPPGTVVVDGVGGESGREFSGYHSYDSEGRFAYAVIPWANFSDARLMTVIMSHELVEAATDPQTADDTLGWIDNQWGEIADIPLILKHEGYISNDDLYDWLEDDQGNQYLLQAWWSERLRRVTIFGD